MITALDHFVMTTSHLKECLHFYEECLGMQHLVHNGQHELHFGVQKINLHTRPGEFQPAASNIHSGSQDFCLIARGNIDDIKAELELKGIHIIEGVCDRMGAQGPIRSIYIYDPDGNLVEIAVYPE